MEYRCRLGTPGGEIIEGVYAADSEARLRREFEEKGLLVLAIHQAGRRALAGFHLPALLVLPSLVVVTIIVVKVVPEFGNFYNQFGKELPLSTRFIVGLSRFVTSYVALIVGGIVALVAAALWSVRQPGQRRRLHRLILRLPMLGGIAQKFSTSQGARTLATLLGGGIPLVNALEVTARSLSNQYMAGELHSAAQQVREGRALAMAMQDSGAFPDVAIKMVEVGEST